MVALLNGLRAEYNYPRNDIMATLKIALVVSLCISVLVYIIGSFFESKKTPEIGDPRL